MTDVQEFYLLMELGEIFICKYIFCNEGGIRYGIECKDGEIREIPEIAWAMLIEAFRVIVRQPLKCGCVIEIINPTYVDWRTLPAELEF